MKAYVIEKSSLNILLDRFLEKYRVIGPTKPGPDSTFNEISLKCEMLVRSYDPCISCSSH
jgi:Ni,Fe-hydrogenase I large subunit